MIITKGRSPGPYSTSDRWRCPHCRKVLDARGRYRSCSLVAHRRPVVAGEALTFDDDLDLQSMITGQPVMLVPCPGHWGGLTR